MKLKENLVLSLVSSLLANIILYLSNKNEENPPSYKLYAKNAGLIFVITFIILVIYEKMPNFMSSIGKSNLTGGGIETSTASVEPSTISNNLQEINIGEPTF